MKRSEMVKSLVNEGLTEKTLVNLSDKNLQELIERIVVKASDLNNPNIKKIAQDPTIQAQVVAEKNKSVSSSKRDDQVKQGAYDGRFKTKIVKDKKKEESKNWAKKKTEIAEEKPSAGLSKEKKSEIVKKAKKGEDIGKKGKGFEKIVAKAKESGADDPKAVAASAMWKNIKKESVEVKNWIKTLAENNFHSFTSKGEIMELVQIKMNEVGPNVKRGHNNIPEFMSYNSIKKSEVKESGTKTKPKVTPKPGTKPGTKPKTPYQPGPGKDPKPKALKETEQ